MSNQINRRWLHAALVFVAVLFMGGAVLAFGTGLCESDPSATRGVPADCYCVRAANFCFDQG